ncbi:hypothetical protein GHK92_18430 [Nocardioides sp. dk4132]|uniref:universal stress protein n=1 Tax=unclassified Nocardioides TaxID=2615069 RepID=UPI00129496DC|nr:MULTISPECIES: universal stress protein [unclassified Nocardioides]MQW77852.1 hypothetical protein [Nocardioides sp. dk4132]QGA08242.1 hypothetical protein GFH29_13135 [Nocardioides sp. dk884]
MSRPARASSVVLSVPLRDLDPALRFAVREAQLLGSSLRIVGHEGAGPRDRTGPSPPMERALRTARALAGPAAVITAELHPSPVVESALRADPDARVVVVQRSDVDPLLEALGNLEASASVPAVACVPPGWHVVADPRHPITVAVDDPVDSRHLLRAALGFAASHRLPLRVVHAWALNQPSGGSPPTEAVLSRWSHLIGEELGRMRESTDVFVNLEIQLAPPAQALVEHSRESTALLIGARRAAYGAAPGLGLLTRVLLQQAACPVIVVPDAPVSALHPGSADGSAPPLSGRF